MSNDEVTVRLSGELDLSNRETLERALAQVSEERDRVVVLDLSGLEFVEAHAVARWHVVGLHLRDRGSRLVLRHPRPVVERMMSLMDLDGAVEVDSSDPAREQ
ncbi:MAG TPA: STAS domain-containing protein [Acidimicrobiia bacterium]|nr:STAS domain-containing protein [Acidimicrobiia bacterium]